jgi:hypothetical protein
MTPSPNKIDDHFGTGLIIGTLVGIASYYFLGTKEGDRLKRKLIHNFEANREQLDSQWLQFLEAHHTQLSSLNPKPFQLPTPPPRPSLASRIKSIFQFSSSSTSQAPPSDTPSHHHQKKAYFTRMGKKVS